MGKNIFLAIMLVTSVVAILFVAVFLAWWRRKHEKECIEQDVKRSGGRLLGVRLAQEGGIGPHGSGQVIYDVLYHDAMGQLHAATAHCAILAPVAWRDDRVLHEKKGWYESIPAGNLAGDPWVRYLSIPAEEIENTARVDEEAAETRKQLGQAGF